ncbi:MAG: MarR family winged helix-turn-helix transcriptional regulator [Devosia sp.]
MFDHKETLFHVASLLTRQLQNGLREALAPYGLHPAQFTALAEIGQREGLTQAELVLRLDLEQPGVARTLTGLEAEGWIERSSLGKGRAQGLYLSQRARGVLPDAAVAAAEADRHALASLSRTEAALLIDGLQELAAANRV